MPNDDKKKKGALKKGVSEVKNRASRMEEAERAILFVKTDTNSDKKTSTQADRKKDPFKSDMDRLRGIKTRK